MGILLCEKKIRDVWRRNKSVGQKFVKCCAHTHKHTHAAKLVVRITSLPLEADTSTSRTSPCAIPSTRVEMFRISVSFRSPLGVIRESRASCNCLRFLSFLLPKRSVDFFLLSAILMFSSIILNETAEQRCEKCKQSKTGSGFLTN